MSAFTSPRETREGSIAVGTNVAKVANEDRQRKTIERILTDAQKKGDSAGLQNSITEILSQVSPERQGQAIKYIQTIADDMKVKRERKAVERAGIDPDLPSDLQKLAFQQKSLGVKRSAGSVQFEKDLFKDVFETLQEAPGIRQNVKTLDRLDELVSNLEGVPGEIKALFGSKDAKEFNALGLSALEAPIKALFKRGVISKDKFLALKDAFVPTASENRLTQRGKIQALRSFTEEALKKVDRVQGLFNEFGIDLPVEEVMRFNTDSEDLFNQAKDQGANFRGSVDPSQQQAALPGQGTTPGAPPQEESLATKGLNALKGGATAVLSASGLGPLVPDDKTPPAPPTPPPEPKAPPTAADFPPAGLQVARGAAKAVGATADFANFLGSIIGGASVDVEKHTKEMFGEAMDFEKLTEKAFDYVTFGAAQPKGMLDRYVQGAAKTATEFALPAGLFKNGKALMGPAAMEGFIAGTSLQTAKEAELGPAAEMVALFLPNIVKNSPALYAKALEVAENPAMLKEAGKDFINFVKDAPGKALEAAKELPGKAVEAAKSIPGKVRSGVESVKERLKKPTAQAIVKKLDLKASQIIDKGVAQTKTKVRQPLSEVFRNEEVNAIEAKMSQHPEGAAYYKPLFDTIAQENFTKYEEVLAKSSRSNPKNFTAKFDDPKSLSGIKDNFYNAVFKESESTKSQFRADFKRLTNSRPKGDRLTFRQTQSLIKKTNNAIDDLRKGGTKTGDKRLIEELESFRDRLTMQTPATAKEIKSLEEGIQNAQKQIKANESKFGKMIDKIPEIRKAQTAHADLIKKNKKQIEKLGKTGAEVEEVEFAYRKFNRAINWEKAFNFQDIKSLQVRGAIKSALEQYGRKNPKYIKNFNAINARYADKKGTILSDMVFDFLHGEDPDLVKQWLKNPKSVKEFNKLIASTEDLFFKEIGDSLKSAKAHEMILPKLFDKNKSVRPNPGKFSPEERSLLRSLMGDEAFNQFNQLTKEFAKDSKKLDAYLNRSLSGVHVSIDGKKALKASGVWDFMKAATATFRGNLGTAAKETAKGAGKIAAANQDKILSAMLTDTKFQQTLLEVLKDVERTKPNYKGIEKMGKLLKERGLSLGGIIKEEAKD